MELLRDFLPPAFAGGLFSRGDDINMKILWKCIAVLGIVSMLFGLSSCSKKQDVWDDNIAPDEVSFRATQDVVFHGGYVYFPYTIHNEKGKSIAKAIMRQNLSTGEISSPCQDPLCTHDNRDCPFYCGLVFVVPQIFGDEWMVIQSNFNVNYYEYGYSRDSTRILYNLKTGEYRRIFKLQNPKEAYDGLIFYDGSDLFNTSPSDTKETDENGEEYFPWNVYKHDLKTGKESVIFTTRYSINIIAVTQKKVYYYVQMPGEEYGYFEQWYYCYDMETGETTDLSEKIPRGTGVLSSYKNKLYAKAGYYASSAIIDMETGENLSPFKEVLDDVQFVYVDQDSDTVYYATREHYMEKERAFAKWYQEWYRETKDLEREAKEKAQEERKAISDAYDLEWRTTPLKIWKSALDGSNLEYICEINNTATNYFSIHDGYIYFRYTFIDPETGEIDNMERYGKLSRINLSTGELTVLDELFDAQEEKSK